MLVELKSRGCEWRLRLFDSVMTELRVPETDSQNVERVLAILVCHSPVLLGTPSISCLYFTQLIYELSLIWQIFDWLF